MKKALWALAATSALLALIAVAPGYANDAIPKRLSTSGLTLGTAPIKDRTVHVARKLSRTSRSSWWGGTYYTSRGEPVRVNVSDQYLYDPGYAQSVVDFLGGLTHGSEISRLTLWIAPLDLTESICGADAVGCYDPSVGFLNVIGDDVGGYTVEEVLMHEYGHHVANNRSNAPWPAAIWGTKRWASYENVCSRTTEGVAFPGDEGTHYMQNPGEAFAESYMFMNAQRFALALPPWDFDPMFTPDYNALSKISQDVTAPWNGERTFAWGGKFQRRRATRSATLSTPLDGNLTLQLAAPRGTVLRVYSQGQLLASVTRGVSGTLCGERALTTRLVSGAKGRFRVVARIP
jgi:hypothetical protein